jgi:uncharacterized protein (DUF2126 family)
MDERTKIELFLDALKQPSTIKGILGLLAVAGFTIDPDKWMEVVTGLSTIYFLIAIFWQKS